MALTQNQIDELREQLRTHLGYGNVNVGAYPYTPDGFLELFAQVVVPNLTLGTETSATTAVVAGTVTAVTPAAMTNIVPYTRLVVDVGDDAEMVVVAAVTGTTFTARFLKAHAVSGYPIAAESGLARVRMLLHSADKGWEKVQSSKISGSAGLKSLGKGEIEWFQGGAVLRETLDHYRTIARQLGDVVRVRPRWDVEGGDNDGTLEAY